MPSVSEIVHIENFFWGPEIRFEKANFLHRGTLAAYCRRPREPRSILLHDCRGCEASAAGKPFFVIPDAEFICREREDGTAAPDQSSLYTNRDDASATPEGNDIGPVGHISLPHCRPVAETQKRHERHHVTY